MYLFGTPPPPLGASSNAKWIRIDELNLMIYHAIIMASMYVHSFPLLISL